MTETILNRIIKIWLAVAGLAMACPLWAQGQAVTLNAPAMVAGETVTIQYDCGETSLAGEQAVYGFAYVYENYQWRVYDIDMRSAGENLWQGAFDVPRQAGFVAFKFQETLDTRPEKTDCNGSQGYLYQVYAQKKGLMPGADIGKAAFLSHAVMTAPGYQGVGGYFDQDEPLADKEMLKALIAAERKHYAKNLQKYFYEEVNLYRQIYGTEADAYIRTTLKEVEGGKNLDENALYNLSYAYLFLMQDKERSHQWDEQMLARFPHGRLARLKAIGALNSLKGDDYMQAAMLVRRNFPVEIYYRNMDFQGYIYGNFYRRLSQELFDAGQYDLLEEVMKEMNSGMLEDAFTHQPKQWMKFADRDPNQYYGIAKKYIEEMQKKYAFHGNMDGTGASAKQRERYHLQYLEYCKTIFTELAYRTGHYGEGVAMMESIPLERRFNYDPNNNETFVRCLEQLGRSAEIPAALQSAASHSKLTPDLLERLKNYYAGLEEKPSSGFDDYLYSLKTEEAKREIWRSVRRGLVSDPYTPFSVEDVNGGRVSSADFGKDDIIVLDFWAMWCAPCCAALVGMQMAVEKYLGDEHVKFFFVDTQDRATKEQLNRYWKDKGYHDMLVVFDQDRPGTHDGALLYGDMFPGTSGIPQKAILKGGKVRYRASGYMGSPSGLMDEISAVIEILKKE